MFKEGQLLVTRTHRRFSRSPAVSRLSDPRISPSGASSYLDSKILEGLRKRLPVSYAQMHHAVRRERPDVPARVPSPLGDNQRTQRRSSSRTPRTLQPPKQLRTPMFGAGAKHSRGLEVVDSSVGPESRTRVPFLACGPASDCGSPDPRPWSARMRHRAPPLPVHPPHCPGTGDAWLPLSRVPSSPWAPKAALRLRVCRASAPGEAAPGGARAAAPAPRHPCRGAAASGAPARHRLRAPVPAAPPRHAPPLGRPLRGPAAR